MWYYLQFFLLSFSFLLLFLFLCCFVFVFSPSFSQHQTVDKTICSCAINKAEQIIIMLPHERGKKMNPHNLQIFFSLSLSLCNFDSRKEQDIEVQHPMNIWTNKAIELAEGEDSLRDYKRRVNQLLFTVPTTKNLFQWKWWPI